MIIFKVKILVLFDFIDSCQFFHSELRFICLLQEDIFKTIIKKAEI